MNAKKGAERHRFGIVAADPLRILGLQMMFPADSGIEVVALDGTSTEAMKSLSLIVIDASCTEMLFELIAEIQKAEPQVRLIVMGLEVDSGYVQRVIGAGVKGYLAHTATEAEIRMAMEIVLDGSVWAPRKVLARLLERGLGEQQALKKPLLLTPRERDVLRKLGTGSSNKEIATQLEIDASAVKAHVGRLMRKLGVSNRTALSMAAMRERLLDEEV